MTFLDHLPHPSPPAPVASRSPGQVAAVLAYHDVATGLTSPSFRRMTIAPSLLGEHLSALAGAGYATVTVSRLCSGEPLPAPAVALTFDDAYASFAATVLPMLERWQLTATVFAPTAFVGRRATWLVPLAEGWRRLSSWADLRDAAAAGIEVGSHGHRHLDLCAASRDLVVSELSESRRAIEDRVGAEVSSLSYPYGHHDRTVRQLAVLAGFSGGCQAGHGLHGAGMDPMRLRRVVVRPDTTGDELLQTLARPAREQPRLLPRGATGTPWRLRHHPPSNELSSSRRVRTPNPVAPLAR